MFTPKRSNIESHVLTKLRQILFLGALGVATILWSTRGWPQEKAFSSMNQEKAFSSMKVGDLIKAAEIMRRSVAYVDAEHPPPEGQPMSRATFSGWCIVSGPSELTCQALLVHGATDISIKGPAGHLPGRIYEYNVRERWAKIRTEKKLVTIGLQPAAPSPEEERTSNMEIFALIHTEPNAGALSGILLDRDPSTQDEGYIRADLQLRGGMPVFDKYMRWVGISRSSIWDKDQTLLIPPEMTTNATTSIHVSTATSTVKPPPRPWWSK